MNVSLRHPGLLSWWQGRSGGERRALVLLALVVAAVVAWLGLWQPLSQYRQQAMQRSASALALHAHLREQAPAMAARAAAVRTLGAEDVPAWVAGQARGYALALEAVSATGSGQWQVQARSADPAALLAFVQGLSAAGLSVLEVNIARQPTGDWRAQLMLSV